VVLYDPRRDVAVLWVPRMHGRPLHFAPSAQRAASAIVAGYPRNSGHLVATPARIGSLTRATAPDIYDRGMVTRSIYSVRALVQPGNSGGPLLSPSGAVYGVVFAAAVGIKNVGYALTAGEVGSDVRKGRNAQATSLRITQPWHCA
jgi:S1-C subfamily serine protease